MFCTKKRPSALFAVSSFGSFHGIVFILVVAVWKLRLCLDGDDNLYSSPWCFLYFWIWTTVSHVLREMEASEAGLDRVVGGWNGGPSLCS